MKKRNMIPESNGLYRVDMKEPISKTGIWKRVVCVILIIFSIGFIFQQISNFIGGEKISSSLYYASVNGEKLEYDLEGAGDYTVVFDGAIGTNLYQWKEITRILQTKYGVKTFVYNRAGYGFSGITERKTPKEQAQDLKILLRKAGNSGKLILVGEEYGSLVMTNFAKLYPDSVSAMLLIKPLNENTIKSNEYRKKLLWTCRRSKLQTIGTYFGLTTILEHYKLNYSVEGFEKSLDKYSKEEYEIECTKTNYREAIQYELYNLYNYKEKSQANGIVAGKPLYIISNNPNDSLASLGNPDLTTVFKTKSKQKIISVTNREAIEKGISNILRERKKIDKKTD